MPPEKSAETSAGAAEAARGNHECSGARPAIAPMPSSSSTKAMLPGGRNTAGIRHNSAKTAIPAKGAAARRPPCRTSRQPATLISPKPRTRAKASAASTVSAIPSTSTQKAAERAPPSHAAVATCGTSRTRKSAESGSMPRCIPCPGNPTSSVTA